MSSTHRDRANLLWSSPVFCHMGCRSQDLFSVLRARSQEVHVSLKLYLWLITALDFWFSCLHLLSVGIVLKCHPLRVGVKPWGLLHARQVFCHVAIFTFPFLEIWAKAGLNPYYHLRGRHFSNFWQAKGLKLHLPVLIVLKRLSNNDITIICSHVYFCEWLI